MTIKSEVSRARYVSNGVTNNFAISFPYLTNNDGTAQIAVYVGDSDTPLVEGKDYTVNGFGKYDDYSEQVDDGLITYETRYEGGEVLLKEVPADQVPVAIVRDIPQTQGVVFVEGEDFPARDFENALDKLTMQMQEVKENLQRSIVLPPTSTEKPIEVRDNILVTARQAQETADRALVMVNEATSVIEESTPNAIKEVNTTGENMVEKARVWAEGEQDEVEELGGELSSRGFANFAMAIANAPEDVPIDQSKLLAMSIVKGPKGDKGDKGDDGKDGGGLEIGDVAFAVMGIDESKNLRRYLNGQVISQSQFVSFTNWVKERAKLYPNTVATEENWQAEVTNSKLGQCGKFVIDDTLGTIRLPKVVNINGLQDLSLLGGIKAESLPNITGDVSYSTSTGSVYGSTDSSGALYTSKKKTYSYGVQGTQATTYGIGFDASLSSSTYQDNAPVQQEAIQYPYFIQVATGVEESVDVTREIELNNPFSLLDYKWSEYELNNASWLISNGAFHSGTVYKAVYELLLKIKNGTETKEGVSVKLASETHEDTDFVLNTSNTTFRLPIRTKDDYVVEKYDNGSVWCKVYKSGWVEQGGVASAKTVTLIKAYKDTNYNIQLTSYYTGGDYFYHGVSSRTTSSFVISSASTPIAWVACGQGVEKPSSNTYFYVGETIQDANVINASGVLTRVAELSDEYIVGLGMPDYSAGISLSSVTNYTAPFDGLIVFWVFYSGGTNTITVNGNIVFDVNSGGGNMSPYIPIKLEKGDVVEWTKTNWQLGTQWSKDIPIFYPLKGAK